MSERHPAVIKAQRALWDAEGECGDLRSMPRELDQRLRPYQKALDEAQELEARTLLPWVRTGFSAYRRISRAGPLVENPLLMRAGSLGLMTLVPPYGPDTVLQQDPNEEKDWFAEADKILLEMGYVLEYNE